MSILIKGMEMPTDGTYNIVYIYSDGRVSMPFWGKGMQIVQDINAVPIPQHGRLIDADIMIKRYEPDINRRIYGGNFIFDLEHAPTVIEAESYSERELQRDYEASVEYAQHCERYEPTYDPDTGAM